MGMACVFPLNSSAMDTRTAMIRVMRDGEYSLPMLMLVWMMLLFMPMLKLRMMVSLMQMRDCLWGWHVSSH